VSIYTLLMKRKSYIQKTSKLQSQTFTSQNFKLCSLSGMRLKFPQKTWNWFFSGIPDFHRSYILLEMNRSLSQISVELWILKIRLSKFYRKMGLIWALKIWNNLKKSHACHLVQEWGILSTNTGNYNNIVFHNIYT